MGYLEDLIKAKLVQLGDTTLKTVAPIVRHARTRAKVTREAEEGTNRLWQLRTLPKVIQQDNRTTTQKAKDRKEANEKHQQYQLQLNELKATEGFDNLLKLTSPSTYVEAATGLQLTPAGRLATDILIFGMAGGVKSLLTEGGSKAISSQRTLGLIKGISGEIPTTPTEWTAAQDAAIARGDMVEAQRLRDLHSTLVPSATPGKYYRGTRTKRTSYLDRHVDEEVGEMNGIYMTKNPKYAKTYGDVEEFYLYSNNPLYTEGSWTGIIDDATRTKIENSGYDAVVNNRFDTGFLNKLLKNSRDETITFDGRNIKLADAVTYDNNGVRIPLGERDNFDINDIRWFSTHPITRASKVHLTRNNPLQTRLARLREHTRYGFTPETNLGLMITPRIRSHYVKAFAKQIDPNLTEELLNLIAQIAYTNGRGMHIPIGNNVGETIGGLSIVDIQNAIKYLKQSGIKDVTPNDIGIIAGHEAGHGVQISPTAKRAIEGFSEPDEFYTRAGQVLDAAGIKSTANKRILFNQFMNMIDDYLSKGNLDNGVSEIRDFLRSKTEAVDRQNIMKHINELSGFSGATYLGSKYYEKKIH